MKFFHNNMEFDIPQSVYEPREDSLLLLESVKEIKGKKVLEVGCGSGIISIILAKQNDVTAVDINEEAVEATKKNAEMNNVHLKCFQSDLFSDISDTFDIILFNPPYLPAEEEDLTYSGGADGRQVIEKFIPQCRNYLKNDGEIYLLISSLTGKEEVMKLFRKNNFSAEIIKKEKISWEELIVICAHPDKI